MLVGAADIGVQNLSENARYWAKKLEKQESKNQSKGKRQRMIMKLKMTIKIRHMIHKQRMMKHGHGYVVLVVMQNHFFL